MITLGKDICTNFDEATSREWLETNGIGGFAGGSISGAMTRRYHGLLTAATQPPLGRITMLSKFEETLLIDDVPFELSSNRYPGTVYPQGYKYITGFRLDPFPIWTYEAGGIEIEKRVFMVHGENTTLIKYSVTSKLPKPKPELKLELRPLISFVDYHHLQHETADFNGNFDSSSGVASIRPYDSLPALFFRHNAAAIEKSGNWYKNFEDEIEQERGFDYMEDLFQPFVLTFDLAKDATVIISTELHDIRDAAKLETNEIKRRAGLIKTAKASDDFTEELVLAADQFIVNRGEGETVIAGYPWFSDWGRDTMIALPGLTLSTNRPNIAKGILLEFSKHISQGMLPNRFGDADGEAEYNTVDATLWYFEAIRAYAAFTNDYALIETELYEKLADIIAWHLRGTRYNIHVDTDGLLYAGEEGVQLTWMDAKIGDKVITPRTGKPVEIEALWFNALMIMADFAKRFGDGADQKLYLSMAKMCEQSFNAVFWNDEEDCLYDVVVNGSRDGSIRPNQIFAASLPFSMLDDEKAKKVIEKVESELLTPVGLRSLSPHDSRYVPVYIGSPYERDSAYHQGTVWAWLIGGFVDGYRRVFPEREDQIAGFLEGFRAHLGDGAVGQIAEIFDADPPHRPRGCFAQAWSVAEVLRVIKTT
jgi:predicted glycogen debranching enzyme